MSFRKTLSQRRFDLFQAATEIDANSGYDEKLRWLMMNDQMVEQVICCNKFLCRGYVRDRVGVEVLLDLYGYGRTMCELEPESFPLPFVLKLNNDSGSVRVVHRLSQLASIGRRFRREMRRPYGLEKGEWAYSHIVTLILAEEFMKPPVIDYKFHCSRGKILWVQTIAERDTGVPMEAIVDRSFRRLPIHLNHQLAYASTDPVRPESWNSMMDIAMQLSEEFRYVRVDLYDWRGMPKFGELTFWPYGGQANSRDDAEFGRMLQFDTSFRRPVIHDLFSGSGEEKRTVRRLVQRLGLRGK